MKNLVSRSITLLFVIGAIALVVVGLMPTPVEVDLAKVQRGAIRVTVDQDGKSRIRERYVVSTPLAGRLLRVELDPGDPVAAGKTLLAVIEPRDPELLDARAVAQAEARVKAAQVALEKMEPTLEEVRAAQEYSESELKRVRDARSKNPQTFSESEVENKLLAYRVRTALLRSAQHNEEIARFELDQAKAALIRSRPQENGELLENLNGNGSWNFLIRSPIDGRVLRVFQESSAVIAGGTALLELGDPLDLEIEIDVLSRDAVKIEPGARVLLENWGGARTLQGQVRLVEPSAFTKISTLGVEEQRVNVIVDLLDPPRERTALGDGFRVEARIVVAEAADVLKVPSSALFRDGEQWAVFQAEQGIAKKTILELGLQNGLEAEVRSGLEEGHQVIIHPGDQISAGRSVQAR